MCCYGHHSYSLNKMLTTWIGTQNCTERLVGQCPPVLPPKLETHNSWWFCAQRAPNSTIFSLFGLVTYIFHRSNQLLPIGKRIELRSMFCSKRIHFQNTSSILKNLMLCWHLDMDHFRQQSRPLSSHLATCGALSVWKILNLLCFIRFENLPDQRKNLIIK